MLISPPGIRFVSSEFYLDISKYPKFAKGEFEGKELCVLLAQRCSAVALVICSLHWIVERQGVMCTWGLRVSWQLLWYNPI